VSTRLVVAGGSCSGRPLHRWRSWGVDEGRRLHVIGTSLTPEQAHAYRTLPVPGEARVVEFLPFKHLVLLEDGDTWRLDATRSPIWRPLTTEDEMKRKFDGGPVVAAAGVGCGGLMWFATPDRRLWQWSATGRTAIGGAPVPDGGRIVAVRLRAAPMAPTVLLECGVQYSWFDSGGWGCSERVVEPEPDTVT